MKFLGRYGFGIPFTITLTLLAVQFYSFRPYFLVNDDIFKIMAVKGLGAGGAPTPFFGESNILLGYLFQGLYGAFPTPPFYPLFLIGVQGLSLFLVLDLLWRGADRGFRTGVFVICYAGVLFLFFRFLQFTMTAELAAGAGILAWGWDLGRGPDPGRKARRVLAILLLVGSCLIRSQALAFMGLAALPFLVTVVRRAGWRRVLREEGGYLLVTALVLAGVEGFDLLWLQQHPVWRDYFAFLTTLKRTLEFSPFEPTERVGKALSAVGWSWNDYWMLHHWYLSDTQKFGTPVLKALNGSLPWWGGEGKTGGYHSFWELLASPWDLRILLYGAVLAFFGRREDRTLLWSQGIWIFLLFIPLVYAFKATDRVTLPLLVFWMQSSLVLAGAGPFSVGGRSPWSRPKVRSLLLAGALVLVAFPWAEQSRSDKQMRVAEGNMRACLDAMAPLKDRLWVLWDFPLEYFGAFDDLERFRPYRFVVCSALQRSPLMEEGLSQWGLRDPFLDAVDDPRVLVFCDGEQGGHYHDYLWENRKKRIVARKDFQFGDLKAFSIHSAR